MNNQFQLDPHVEQVLPDDRAMIEHARMLQDLSLVLKTSSGRAFIKYLLKNYGEIPPQGLSGDLLHDAIGFQRAWKSIFEIASQADPTITGMLIAEIQKEKYDVLKVQTDSNGQR